MARAPGRIAIGSDHAATALREGLAAHLRDAGWDVRVFGPALGERSDYPDQAADVGRRVAAGDVDLGILTCGTGIGVSIAANKIPGVRAALVHDPETARLAAEHNRANVLCIGGRIFALEYATTLVDIWLSTAFEERHQHRIDKIAALETDAVGEQ
jgi:RpiB/LacA/LacB family sugar-phosphate isomerase